MAHLFMTDSLARVQRLVADSDIFTILAKAGNPPSRYLCSLTHIEHLVKSGDGLVQHSHDPIVFEIHLPPDYLYCTDGHLGLKTVSLLTPVFHPNVGGHALCLGDAFHPGTPVDEIVRMVYEVVSYQNVTSDERNAFNHEACRYFREHAEELKRLDIAPLRRRKISNTVHISKKQ